MLSLLSGSLGLELPCQKLSTILAICWQFQQLGGHFSDAYLHFQISTNMLTLVCTLVKNQKKSILSQVFSELVIKSKYHDLLIYTDPVLIKQSGMDGVTS